MPALQAASAIGAVAGRQSFIRKCAARPLIQRHMMKDALLCDLKCERWLSVTCAGERSAKPRLYAHLDGAIINVLQRPSPEVYSSNVGRVVVEQHTRVLFTRLYRLLMITVRVIVPQHHAHTLMIPKDESSKLFCLMSGRACRNRSS